MKESLAPSVPPRIATVLGFSGLLDGFLGVIDQVHARLDLLFHVAVLFFDDEGYGTFAVFLVEKLDDMSHQLLAAGEHGAVVVTDNVVKACRRHISAHFTEMENPSYSSVFAGVSPAGSMLLNSMATRLH